MVFSIRLNWVRSPWVWKTLAVWLICLYGFWATRNLWNRSEEIILEEHVSQEENQVFSILPITLEPGLSASNSEAKFNTPLDGTTALPDKIVVVGKVAKEDTSWIEKELLDWQNAIYSVDNQSAPLHTPANKGKEVMPYLTYIIDNYDNLPSIIAFLHAHRDGYPQAWHTDSPDHSNPATLQHLNLNFVKSNGYANLRCVEAPGCPGGLQPFRDPPGSEDDPLTETEALMHKVWPQLFPDEVMPRVFAVACCAQFAVSRERIRERPRSDYMRWRKWLLDIDMLDVKSGGLMEYLWHVIFGMEAEYCPSYATCRCDVYNEC